MKFSALMFSIFFAWLLTGCFSVSVKDNLVMLEQDYFPDSKAKLTVSRPKKNRKLIAAYQQVTSLNSAVIEDERISSETLDSTQPLPSYLAFEPLIQKIVIAAHEAVVNKNGSTVHVMKDNISSLTRMLNHTFIAKDINNLVSLQDSKKSINKIILKYLSDYYSGQDNGFVNREGTSFKRPEIKNSVGNDVITAVVAIVLEGLFDGILDTTVYATKKNSETCYNKSDEICYQTIEGRAPSAAKHQFANKEFIVSRGEIGIDDIELKAIRYLSGLAGDQSKALSGIVYRSFGGISIGFVIGGQFSFGDNETMAKIIDTVFEVVSKRIVEETARQGFERLTFNYSTFPNANASKAERLLYDLQ